MTPAYCYCPVCRRRVTVAIEASEGAEDLLLTATVDDGHELVLQDAVAKPPSEVVAVYRVRGRSCPYRPRKERGQ